MATMRAAVFEQKNKIAIREVPKPVPGPGEALIRVTLTTICGTDVHILRGEYPVKPGLTVGHEPVGVVDSVGVGVTGYEPGDRVVVGAITPCGQCRACLSGSGSQCSHGGDGYEALGGWRAVFILLAALAVAVAVVVPRVAARLSGPAPLASGAREY